MNSITLHHAPWVVPVSHPVIADGIVAVQNNKILDIGSYDALSSSYPDARTISHTGKALIPALINAHIHLELSHICIPDTYTTVTGFTGWIEKLLQERERSGAVGKKPEEAASQTLRLQHELGVIGLGDIGNTDIGNHLAKTFPGALLHFNEVLGRSTQSRRSILNTIAKADATKMYTAHAPYSTHPELIQALKQRARQLDHPFPIHVAEPQSEGELLSRGSGELYDFLSGRGFIDSTYDPPATIDKPGSVQYLNDLGILDNQTICVHCIHLSPEEIRILSNTKTNICLCPGSNRYLNVGRAPVRAFLEHGLLPALGTDSCASNPELSIWREMRILQEDQPQVKPSDIFSMATLGGAKALGIEKNYGSLGKGKKAQFLAVQVPENTSNPDTLYDMLVNKNEDIKPSWV